MNGTWNWTKQITVGSLVRALALVEITSVAGKSARSKPGCEKLPSGQLVGAGRFEMHVHHMREGNPAVIVEAGLDDFAFSGCTYSLKLQSSYAAIRMTVPSRVEARLPPTTSWMTHLDALAMYIRQWHVTVPKH
jgi:hypothetical protein